MLLCAHQTNAQGFPGEQAVQVVSRHSRLASCGATLAGQKLHDHVLAPQGMSTGSTASCPPAGLADVVQDAERVESRVHAALGLRTRHSPTSTGK